MSLNDTKRMLFLSFVYQINNYLFIFVFNPVTFDRIIYSTASLHLSVVKTFDGISLWSKTLRSILTTRYRIFLIFNIGDLV